jgi:glycosyltransferase involved in cell wall biosynthesis
VTRRIRVMFVIDSLNQDAGTEKQLIALVRNLDPSHFETIVACIEDGEPLRQLAPRAATLVFPFTRVFSLRGLVQARRLRSEINRRRVDIVHTFMVRATILGVMAARGTVCKTVLTSRRNVGHWYTPFYVRVFRFLNRRTTRIVANSEGAKRAAMEIEGAPESQIDVLYNGVDLAQFSAVSDVSAPGALGIAPAARVVGIVANYRPVKDLAMFLEAASMIAAHDSRVVFLLAGRGPLREQLGQIAQRLGIANKVFFTDGVGSVASYLALMEVACLSSRNESFSNAILEYMAAGLPVVATDVGGNREAIVDGVTGFLTPAGEAPAFAKAVIALLDDERLRKGMGERGRARCRERFGMEACIRRLEDYYESLAPGGSG